MDLLLVGDDPNLQLSFGWMDAWELNPELDSLWLKASATLGGGGITLAEVLHDRVEGDVRTFRDTEDIGREYKRG
jgi:hypothetical protein